VAVYPQGHIETDTLEQDMEYTKLKIDAGADFAVTQMFFDNTYYYALLERMHKKRSLFRYYREFCR
jgi:5,10-methylenetetrahydrofolate reductase